MRHKLYKLMWEAFGYPDIPPKLKDFNPIKLNQYTGKPWTPRYNDMYVRYLKNQSLEEISKKFNCTRERVRQCLWKAYGESIRK